ncbi:alpha/beta hydrolase fold domain-containing protein [Frigidibacter albus]|uniref:Alpha/beta hydrolase fold domain-containing protein n=1 Tax=Frigidibacter albus TaxID=1465486 RepID=A0A6L8VEE5_9RHOB|nr:alpha/beta hydrolase [Frigidibacter albus]MZQ88665.1 alpha/beta hydrolase fold domain-containing protein [Frigidibacter albus]NBE30526.1 alpha/beta hydrolase fold domain-containing protein [Frigidibacter albus]GGH49730.1 hydrolase [Frigidibacter albus]
MSRHLGLLNTALRLGTKPALARMRDPVLARAMMERGARWMFRAPPHLLVLDAPLCGVPGLRISAGRVAPGHAILHLHGGAFVAGSPRTHQAMLGRLSRLSGLEVFAPAYRLAPEHPFPAALEDAEAAFAGLLARGYAPERIALGGDSAGGGLAFALLARLYAAGTVPGFVYGFSPWSDLTGSGESIRRNARADPMLPAARLADVAQMYLQGHPAGDPGASPLFAEFPGAPPVLLQVGSTEILLDDSLRLAERLRGFGAAVDLQLLPGVPHVCQLFDGWVPEARAALRVAAAAIRAGLFRPEPTASAGS